MKKASHPLFKVPGVHREPIGPRSARQPLSQMEVGERRRAATRAALMEAAFDTVGEARGRTLRVEEVCERAAVSRATFYNHFDSVEHLMSELAEPLSVGFNAAVHHHSRQLPTMAEQVAMGIRLYLHRAATDRAWGWAMVNISFGQPIMGRATSEVMREDLAKGAKMGDFKIESLQLATDVVDGIGYAAMISILEGKAPKDYPEKVVAQILHALGVPATTAKQIVQTPLPKFDY